MHEQNGIILNKNGTQPTSTIDLKNLPTMLSSYKDPPIQDIDLNLLITFTQIYRDRKVSLAAENLGVSQPTVSAALARLRRLLNDELFVRTAMGMQPTPLADQIAQPVSRALQSIRDTLAGQIMFDPSSAVRQFRLAMTDIGEFHFLPQLMATLESSAPGISVSTVRGTAVNLKFEMEAGNIDFAMGYLPDLVTDFHRRTLFTQRYVCLYRQGHAMDQADAGREVFAQSEHAAVISAGTGHGQVEEIMERSGIRRQIRLRVPHYVALADVLENSNLIATVPEVFAIRSIKHFNLRYRTHPIELPQIDIGLYWHARFHRDPANRWLRNLLADQFRHQPSKQMTR